ncbi:porin [Glaciimonas immobilis]|uniref:Putative porin n=1 Tax=Glaciimonas immobilis TaxID=728004 RepID=A0A840RRI4_9BURK|nr:porin [Glaciimonas immobilis]KAF3997999.1 porin [Glaciimonas immobilis]MBB5199324.1 putative porin [Glaciimonas immobilis]
MSKTVLKSLRTASCLPMVKPLAAAIILAATCAGQAQAQTNVTIYGRVDAGIDYNSNQYNAANGQRGSKWGSGGNSWGTSMFGFKGVEDLGGGLKAIFTLENGFNAANGQTNGGGSTLWSRRSYVGLVGDFGTVKLGRDLTLPSDIVWSLDPTGQQNMGSATLVKGRNWPQTSNQVQYISPSFGGFTAQGAYGFGEVAGATKPLSSSGVALSYVQPSYSVIAMYDVANDNKGQFSTLFTNSKELTLGGTVNIDKLKLYAAYQNLSAPQTVAGPDKANHFWVGANYQLTPALTLIAAAYHVKLNQNVGSANLFMLGTNYSLSKRTLLYASIGTVRNGSNTNFQVETGSGTGLTGQNQNAFYTGVSHSF